MTRDGAEEGARVIPEETAIAFTYGRASYAIMMATPDDLEDFAIGFSLSEGIVATPAEIAELEIVRQPLGIELRMTLAGNRAEALECSPPQHGGACRLRACAASKVFRPRCARQPMYRGDVRIAPATIFAAMAALHGAQPLNAETRAVHGAGFWSADKNELIAVREDVGRHNALDKLIGALARAGQGANSGFIALTSRVSIELVQKAASVGCPMLVAVSAPTAYAVRAADEAGLTLVAVARDDSFEVFTHGERIRTP